MIETLQSMCCQHILSKVQDLLLHTLYTFSEIILLSDTLCTYIIMQGGAVFSHISSSLVIIMGARSTGM